MSRYMAVGFKKRTGARHEACPGTLSMAMAEAEYMKDSKQYRSIIILEDDEGASIPENAGVFGLYRIVK